MTSLTFQDDAPLVSAAMDALLKLIPTLADAGTKEFHAKVERVLDDGVITGLGFARASNGDTIEVRFGFSFSAFAVGSCLGISFNQCLFNAVPKLVEMHGILTARFLKVDRGIWFRRTLILTDSVLQTSLCSTFAAK